MKIKVSPETPQNVAVWREERAGYPDRAPFHPSERFAEYRFGDVSDKPNDTYRAVRECFRLAGLDTERFGTAEWNPLRGFIEPGETVLLKPNLVKEKHPRDPEGWRYVLTHGSVVRAVADYVWLALEGRGKIIIADAPQTDSSFEKIVSVLGLDAVRDYLSAKGVSVDLIDLRHEEWTERDGVMVDRRKLPGDPRGNIAFDLGDKSELHGHPGAGRYYGADYDVAELNQHHLGGRHEYKIAGSAITADVVFSLPKLKTHKKAGVTVTLKNLVGVNGDKNWLPHHTEGDPRRGGDEHPAPDLAHRIERRAVAVLRRLSLSVPVVGPWMHRKARAVGTKVFGDTETVVRSGNWSGNDTVWRMCLDLNKLIAYGNADGTLREPVAAQRKRHFSLVDGIIAGEGNGPMNPDPVSAGMVVFGVNPASVDAVCAWLMGFDPERIPIVRQAFRTRGFALAEWGWRDVRVVSNLAEWNALVPDISDSNTLRFRPHFGWVRKIERHARRAEVA